MCLLPRSCVLATSRYLACTAVGHCRQAAASLPALPCDRYGESIWRLGRFSRTPEKTGSSLQRSEVSAPEWRLKSPPVSFPSRYPHQRKLFLLLPWSQTRRKRGNSAQNEIGQKTGKVQALKVTFQHREFHQFPTEKSIRQPDSVSLLAAGAMQPSAGKATA